MPINHKQRQIMKGAYEQRQHDHHPHGQAQQERQQLRRDTRAVTVARRGL